MAESILIKALKFKQSLSCSVCLSDVGVWSQVWELVNFVGPGWVTSNEVSGNSLPTWVSSRITRFPGSRCLFACGTDTFHSSAWFIDYRKLAASRVLPIWVSMKGGQFWQTELANIDLSKQTKKREAVLIWGSVMVSPDLIIITKIIERKSFSQSKNCMHQSCTYTCRHTHHLLFQDWSTLICEKACPKRTVSSWVLN